MAMKGKQDFFFSICNIPSLPNHCQSVESSTQMWPCQGILVHITEKSTEWLRFVLFPSQLGVLLWPILVRILPHDKLCSMIFLANIKPHIGFKNPLNLPLVLSEGNFV